jgi:hypothetical protein
MQASQLKTLIETYGAALAISGANDTVARVTSLADTIGKGGSQTVTRFLRAIENVDVEPISGTLPHLGDLVPPVEKLVALLTEGGAKKSVVADLKLLLDLLRRRSGVSLAEFESRALISVASASRRRAGMPPADTKQLVESYLQRLEAALGNDGLFRKVYHELSADKNITKVEAIEIASRFLEPMGQSATRPKALQKILYRHEKLLDSRDASKSIGGHKAAIQ